MLSIVKIERLCEKFGKDNQKAQKLEEITLAKREQSRLEEEKEIERITKSSVSYEEMPIEDLSMLSLYRDLKLSTPLKVKVQRYNEDMI